MPLLPLRRPKPHELHEEGVQPREPPLLAGSSRAQNGTWNGAQNKEEGQGDMGVS